MPTPRILVFAGSVRTGSFNTALATLAARVLAERDATVTQISLRDYAMPLYDGDEEAAKGVPPNAEKLAALIGAQHGIFIACPEYNGSITPLLKNTIDWVSRVKTAGQPYKNRVFALGAASPGALGGYRGLIHARHTLELGCGALVLPEMVSVGGAMAAFAEDGSLKDQRTAGMLAGVCDRLVAEAAKLA